MRLYLIFLSECVNQILPRQESNKKADKKLYETTLFDLSFLIQENKSV